jgi:hypothetical protein
VPKYRRDDGMFFWAYCRSVDNPNARYMWFIYLPGCGQFMGLN